MLRTHVQLPAQRVPNSVTAPFRWLALDATEEQYFRSVGNRYMYASGSRWTGMLVISVCQGPENAAGMFLMLRNVEVAIA